MYDGDYKFIWSSNGAHELYDISADPEENRNLVEKEPEVARSFHSRLSPLIEDSRKALTTTAPKMDDDLKSHLKALGYIQ